SDADKCTGQPGSRRRPRVACSSVWIWPRALRCRSSSTSPVSSTAPHGTPALPRIAMTSCFVRARVHAAMIRSGVADGGAAADGLTVGEAGDAHHPTGGLRDHVEALVFRVRAREAEAFDASDDDARIRRAQPLVVEPEPLHQPGGKVLDHDIS